MLPAELDLCIGWLLAFCDLEEYKSRLLGRQQQEGDFCYQKGSLKCNLVKLSFRMTRKRLVYFLSSLQQKVPS